MQQCVALPGRNCTGPPCNVGHPIAHAPGPDDRQRDRRPALLPDGSVTDADRRRRQTTASKTILAH